MNPQRDFELFVRDNKRGRSSVDRPYINIHSGKFIYFRGGFMNKVFQNPISKAFVQILYDKTTNSIGFVFLNHRPQGESSYSLSHNNSNRSFHIVSISFFKYYEQFNKDGKWDGNYEPFKENIPEFGDVWIIDLNKKLGS